MKTKVCKSCGETKDTKDFYWNNTAFNGGNICKSCKRKRDAGYRDRNREKLRESQHTFYKNNPEKVKSYGKKARDALRQQILNAYGNRCDCCGETREEFLTLDHIGGGGRQHRKDVGSHVYRDLKKRGFPDGFRLLCWNCNSSIGIYGYCPHNHEPDTREN